MNVRTHAPITLLVLALTLASMTIATAQILPSFSNQPTYTFGWPLGNAVVLPSEVDPARPGKEAVAMVPLGGGLYGVHALLPVSAPNQRPWPATYASATVSTGGTQWFCVEQPGQIDATGGSVFIVDINGDGLDDVFVFSAAKMFTTSVLGTGKHYC